MVSAAGRYEVLNQLGTGGFGTVYRARFVGEGGFTKEVALKFLKAPLSIDAELSARLRDEARVLGLLSHRAIVRADTLTQIDGQWTIVMEYVEGYDLAMLLRGGPLPAGVAMEIVAEVASALHAAYTRSGPGGQPLRLVHQDLKPSNIRLTPHGEVKVLDFGIARADFEHRELDGPANMGTLGYMAPERFDRAQLVSSASDVYALGAVAYELLTGRALGLTRASANAHLRTLALAKEQMLGAGVPPEVAELVLASLAREPGARPTADALEARASALARRVGAESLRAWAQRVSPDLGGAPARGALTGAVFTTMDDAIVDPNATYHSVRFPLPPAPDTPEVGEATARAAPREAAAEAPPPRAPQDEPPPHPKRRWPRWAAGFAALGLAGVALRAQQQGPAAPPVQPAAATPAPEVPPPAPALPPAPPPGPAVEATRGPAPAALTRRDAAERSTTPPPDGGADAATPPPQSDEAPAGRLITLHGDARAAFLVRDGQVTPLPARVPEGRYEVLVSFDGLPERLPGGVIEVGGDLTLRCDSQYGKCLEKR